MSVEVTFRACGHRIGVAEVDRLQKMVCPFCAANQPPDVDGEAMWSRFVAHLNTVDPIVFKKVDGQVPHAFLFGSLERYKRIFIESQRANSERQP